MALESGSGATLLGPPTEAATGGYASFSNLSIDQAGGPYTLQVTSSGLSPTTVGPVSITAGTATVLAILTPPPAKVTAGSPFSISVESEDMYGNPASSFSNSVTIALSNKQAGALHGILTRTATDGVITYTGLTLDTTGSDYAIQALSVGMKAATSTAITVNPSAATTLVVSAAPPATLNAGTQFGLSFKVEDAYGNAVTGFPGTVSLSLIGANGPAALSGGATSVSATSGYANYYPLSIDTAAVGYTIQASSPGLAPVSAGPITIIGLPSTQLAVEVQPPSSIGPGAGFGFVVAAVDQYGNPDPKFNGPISIAVPAGMGFSLGGTVTVTASQGVASFQGLTLGGPTNPVSIQVSASGLAGTSTSLISLTTPTTTTTGSGAPVVTMTSVQVVKVKVKHKSTTEILIGFSGSLNAAEASNIAEYTLIQAGKKQSFTGKGTKHLPLLNAVYNAANHTVALTPKRKLPNKPIELILNGQSPSGLEDSNGNLIDGNRDGQPGGNGIAVLKGKTATITAVAVNSAAVDLVLESGILPVPSRKSR